MKLEGLTAVKFAEIMEVQPSSISHLLSGRNKPNFEFLSRLLLRFPRLNPEWFINGTGNIYKNTSHKPPVENTSVNNSNFTAVTREGEALLTAEKEKIEQHKPTELPLNNVVLNDKGNTITNVNTHEVSDKIDTGACDSPVVTTKRISRVIIFYTDGSFDDYHNG